jgi:hypothetical protein
VSKNVEFPLHHWCRRFLSPGTHGREQFLWERWGAVITKVDSDRECNTLPYLGLWGHSANQCPGANAGSRWGNTFCQSDRPVIHRSPRRLPVHKSQPTAGREEATYGMPSMLTPPGKTATDKCERCIGGPTAAAYAENMWHGRRFCGSPPVRRPAGGRPLRPAPW